MPPRLKSFWSLAAILVVALAVRLAAGAWWQSRLPAGQAFGFGDSEGYWVLARTIATGKPYAYGEWQVFRTPGYPAVLAPLFLIANDPPVLWGRILSALLATSAVAAVAWLARLLFDARTSVVAAAIAALYPEAIAVGAFVLSEAPFTPLMLLQLGCWVKAWGQWTEQVEREGSISRSEMSTIKISTVTVATVRWSMIGGIVAGLATLMRPSFLLFVPFAGVIGLGVTHDRRRHLLITSVMLGTLCLTLTPWWVRNYRVSGRFVPTSLQVGASLYDGISPRATGASDMRFVDGFVEEQRQADAESPVPLVGLFEDRLDARMRRAAVEYARQHPRRVLELAATKLLRMWSPIPNAGEFRSPWLRLMLALSYAPVLVLAVIGVGRYAGRGWCYALLALPAVYFTLLHVVFVSSIRYRQPAMLALIVLASAVISTWGLPITKTSPVTITKTS